jgi:Ca-dependent carbohydrate-binding module xylan-binding
MRALPRASLIALAALASCRQGVPASDRVQPIQSFKVDALALPGGCGGVTDALATDRRAIEFWSSGVARGPMELLAPVRGLSVTARGDQCQGAPQLVVRVDGVQVLSADVPHPSWSDFRAPVALDSGRHLFEVSFPNDLWIPPDCDRNLYVDRITFLPARPPGDGGIEGEQLDLAARAFLVADPAASGGRALAMDAVATAAGQVSLSVPATHLVVRARGDQCHGPPTLVVKVDQVQRLAVDVVATAWADYAAPVQLPAGLHEVEVGFPNDFYLSAACDRNLYVDRVSFLPGP